jgi:hypothetical protein
VRTLTALNRFTGTSMDRKLYSVEVVEPEAVLSADLHGLTAEGAALLASLDGREVWLGGKRSKGMGRCRLEVEEAIERDSAGDLLSKSARQAVEALDAALREAWNVLAGDSGALPPLFPDGELPLAVVLREPWSPGIEGAEGEAVRQGPLGGLRVFDAFVELAEEGRFVANEAAHYGAGEHVRPGEEPPRRIAAPGSVYVYAVGRDDLNTRLGDWLVLGLQGFGERRGLGWGRFVVRGPENNF